MQLDIDFNKSGIPVRLVAGKALGVRIVHTQSCKGEYLMNGSTYSALFMRDAMGVHAIVIKRGKMKDSQAIPYAAALAYDPREKSLFRSATPVCAIIEKAISVSPAEAVNLATINNRVDEKTLGSCFQVLRCHFLTLRETIAGMTFEGN